MLYNSKSIALAETAEWDALLVLLDMESTSAQDMDRFGMLPLHWACTEINVPLLIINQLLSLYPEGARIKNNSGMLALHIACRSKLSESHLNALTQAYPSGVEEVNLNGKTPLDLAKEVNLPLKSLKILTDVQNIFLYDLPTSCKEESILSVDLSTSCKEEYLSPSGKEELIFPLELSPSGFPLDLSPSGKEESIFPLELSPSGKEESIFPVASHPMVMTSNSVVSNSFPMVIPSEKEDHHHLISPLLPKLIAELKTLNESMSESKKLRNFIHESMRESKKLRNLIRESMTESMTESMPESIPESNCIHESKKFLRNFISNSNSNPSMSGSTIALEDEMNVSNKDRLVQKMMDVREYTISWKSGNLGLQLGPLLGSKYGANVVQCHQELQQSSLCIHLGDELLAIDHTEVSTLKFDKIVKKLKKARLPLVLRFRSIQPSTKWDYDSSFKKDNCDSSFKTKDRDNCDISFKTKDRSSSSRCSFLLSNIDDSYCFNHPLSMEIEKWCEDQDQMHGKIILLLTETLTRCETLENQLQHKIHPLPLHMNDIPLIVQKIDMEPKLQL